MSTGAEVSSEALRVTTLPLDAAQWHAALVQMAFPAKKEQKDQLWKNLQVLIAEMRAEESLNLSVCLELAELHKENAIKRIGEHGRLWGPEMGLGMVPGEPSPRMWTSADFLDRDYDAPIRELMRSVVFLDTDENGSRHASETMCGSGGLIQLLHSGTAEDLRVAWHALLQPTITEPGLAAYPVYVPLIGVEIARDTDERLNQWLGAVELYMRESPKDGGVFLLSRKPLGEALRRAGFAE